MKGGSVDNKRDGDGDDDGDEEVKRHVIFIDDADDKETGSHNPLRGSGEGNGGGSGSKTPTNSSSDVPRSSNGDGDKDKDKDVIEFLGGLGRD